MINVFPLIFGTKTLSEKNKIVIKIEENIMEQCAFMCSKFVIFSYKLVVCGSTLHEQWNRIVICVTSVQKR